MVLSVIDNKWREHLAEMDYLRAGIGLRAMGQKDPLVEYQREGYDMFSELVAAVKHDTIRYLNHVEVVSKIDPRFPRKRLLPPSPTWAEAVNLKPTPLARSAATRLARAAPARSTSAVMERWHSHRRLPVSSWPVGTSPLRRGYHGGHLYLPEIRRLGNW